MQLAPHIQHVMNKYKGKMPKDDLKRLAKEVSISSPRLCACKS